MRSKPGHLYFDIDFSQLIGVADELQASEKQIKFAISAALKRTATTLRTMAARGLKSELQLRTISLLRKRLKTLKLRAARDSSEISLWYGLNDMPASWFKGRPKRTKTGAEMRGQQIAGGFVAKSSFKGRQTIFKRKGKERLPIAEQNLEIEDSARVYIEDQIFDQTQEIFWRYFVRDLTARVKYSIGER